jgi:hypothetical protein
LFEGKSEGKCLVSSVNGMCPAYRATLLLSKVME